MIISQFIRQINFETQKLLQRIHRQSSHHQVRQRSHCLLLRNQGVKIKQLKTIFKVSEKTLYNWFNAWESRGLVGLYNRPGRVVVACINTFFPKVDKPTVIVVDQASIHTSDMIQSSLDEWRDRNIEIFALPSYSPHLNLIEILWRFMKYQWMEIDSYKDWQSLVNSVEKMLREFGKQYVINFV